MVLGNFKANEFRCICCNGLPESGMDPKLLIALELIRTQWRKPITVSSGFRCVFHNNAIKGALHSQHCLGKAVDLVDPDGTLYDFLDEDALIKLGLSREPKDHTPGWLHLDTAKRNGKYGTFAM